METVSRKAISERMIIRIMLKHKNTLVRDRVRLEKVQDDVNRVIGEFINKTGRKINKMSVEEIDGKYQLKLEVQ